MTSSQFFANAVLGLRRGRPTDGTWKSVIEETNTKKEFGGWVTQLDPPRLVDLIVLGFGRSTIKFVHQSDQAVTFGFAEQDIPAQGLNELISAWPAARRRPWAEMMWGPVCIAMLAGPWGSPGDRP
jgi:hypothetical protein